MSGDIVQTRLFRNMVNRAAIRLRYDYYHRLRTIDTSHHAVIMSHAESGSAWFVIGSCS